MHIQTVYTSDHFQSGTNINAVPACMQCILTVHAAVLHAYNIQAVLHAYNIHAVLYMWLTWWSRLMYPRQYADTLGPRPGREGSKVTVAEH